LLPNTIQPGPEGPGFVLMSTEPRAEVVDWFCAGYDRTVWNADAINPEGIGAIANS
jgi:hypothetical protein